MFRQDRANPGTRVSQWRGRHDTAKGWPSTAVSSWLNGGLFGAPAYAAYMFGGLAGSTEFDGIDKLDFATETRSALVAVIATASYSAASASNNGTAGYTWGGSDDGDVGTRLNETNKLDYATETISAATVLAENRAWQVGVANSPTNAYMAGGTTSGGIQSWVQVWTFSSDTWAADATSLSQANYGMGPMSDNGSYGYWAGGIGPISTIDRTDFSDGTLSTIVATLGSQGNQIGGASNSGTAGYAYGGSGLTDENNKLTYSGETVSTLALGASFQRYGTAGASNSGTAAYWFCGLNAAHGRTNTIQTTAYATDTTSLVTTGTNTLAYAAAVANCESL